MFVRVIFFTVIVCGFIQTQCLRLPRNWVAETGIDVSIPSTDLRPNNVRDTSDDDVDDFEDVDGDDFSEAEENSNKENVLNEYKDNFKHPITINKTPIKNIEEDEQIKIDIQPQGVHDIRINVEDDNTKECDSYNLIFVKGEPVCLSDEDSYGRIKKILAMPDK